MTVERPAPTPPPARPPAAAPPTPPTPPVGLAGLRAHLDRVVQRHGLRSLLVVIDDADLGRQAFRAGTGLLESGVAAAGPGVTSDPPLPSNVLDGELLTALCTMSLRLELLGEADGEAVGEADDGAELALRRLPGVYAVVLEHDGDVTLCHVLATADAPEDVARQAAEALGPSTGAKLVVELRRDPAPTAAAATPAVPAPGPAPAPVPTPPAAAPAPAAKPSLVVPEQFADATWSEDALARRLKPTRATPASAPPAPPEPREAVREPLGAPPARQPVTLLAVRSVPEEGEIEVHVAVGSTRSVGHAPLFRGLAGAAEAVLAAAGQIDASVMEWTPAWVRTVETTADGRFVVAASLGAPSGHRHGIGTGASPIEGAARATARAMAAEATEHPVDP